MVLINVVSQALRNVRSLNEGGGRSRHYRQRPEVENSLDEMVLQSTQLHDGLDATFLTVDGNISQRVNLCHASFIM